MFQPNHNSIALVLLTKTNKTFEGLLGVYRYLTFCCQQDRMKQLDGDMCDLPKTEVVERGNVRVERGWWKRNLRGVETLHTLCPTRPTNTDPHSFLRSGDTTRFFVSHCPAETHPQMPLNHSLNNYVAHIATSMFCPNKISQLIHRFGHPRDSWH